MRKFLIFSLVTTFIILGFIISSVFTLITLLFDNGMADAISPADIPAPGSEAIGRRPQYVPKILHQTWKDENVPEKWKDAHQSCLDLHPDYEIKLWTDNSSREFISQEYPWFLETFDSYRYNIERADAIRYFILHFYGGVYIDLDVGCLRSLDPLLAYPAFVRKTDPTGISNDIMGSVPFHPFFHQVIENLASFNRNWQVPYLTVMYSTGPLMLSVVWKRYKGWWAANKAKASARVWVIMPAEQRDNSWSFFHNYHGSSWHEEDADFILYLAKHWLILTLTGCIAAICIGLGLYIYRKRRQTFRQGSMSTSKEQHERLMA